MEHLPDPFVHERLADVDFSHNNLECLPSEVTLPSVKSLKISHNPRLSDPLKVAAYPKLVILDVEGTDMNYASLPEVREFMTSQKDLWVKSSAKLIRDSVGVGFAEMNGVRDSMEDAIVVRESIRGDISVYAVFDGHAGYRTATYAAFLFPRECLDRAELTPQFLQNTLRTINDRARKQGLVDGSTAVICLRQGNRIAFAHLGDARAIIVRTDGSIRFETADHKPVSRGEYERVRDVGGKVVAGRTDGVLAVTRSIGDFKVFGVSYEPEIDMVDVEEDDKWLIVACDGVWDVTFPGQIRDIASKVKTPTEFAYTLRNAAYAYGSMDNISAIVVDLKHTPEIRSETFQIRKGGSILKESAAGAIQKGSQIVYFVRGDYEDTD
jgi:protein phosphatase 1L